MIIPIFCNRRQYNGILDELGLTALLAYSSTRLTRNFNGYYARIRRVSDNAELDIPFLADGSPDLATANAFIGASSAKVVKVYSQGSRSSSDMAQTSASNQPAWEASSGIPVYTAASSHYLTAGANINLYANSVYTIFANRKTGAAPVANQGLMSNYAAGAGQALILDLATQIRCLYWSSGSDERNLFDNHTQSTSWQSLTWANTLNTTAGQLLYNNGSSIAPPWTTDSSIGSPVVPTSGYGPLIIGRAVPIASYYFDGHIDDVLIFDSVLTAEQIAAINTALAH